MESSSSSSSSSDYTTVWSAPPKKPSGRTKFKETRHPVYRGVRHRGTQNRWVCEARNPNNKSRIWLGTFRTAEMAARAHDVAAMVFKGRSACLNFADSAWLIAVPSSFSSVQELKNAAVRIAEEIHSRNEDSPSSSSSDDDQDTSVVSASSSGETIDETEVVSSQMHESKYNLATDYQIELDFDADGDVNFRHYYASLAEGLMVEPPADWFADLDDSHWGVTVSLWS